MASRFVLALFLVQLAWLLSGCAGESSPRPNFIVLSIDTLRWDALPSLNPDAGPLPTLDALAKQSAVFREALSPASWTLPAHAALMMGLYPDRSGGTHKKVALVSESPTLAERLSMHGYETVGFTGGGFMDEMYGFARGFDRYDGVSRPGSRLATLELPRGGKASEEAGRNLFDRGLAYLRSRDEGARPFFLFLHTYSVHDYFKATPWARARALSREPEHRGMHLRCLIGRRACPEKLWARLRALYRAEVEHLDEGLGAFLRELDRLGLSDSTVLVVLSDHGEGFDGERQRIHHGGRLHQDLIRVPLLVRGPGVEPRVRETPVSLVDVLPTLVELAGLAPDEGLDGRSLVPLLKPGPGGAPEVERRPLLAMEHYYYWGEDGRFSLKDAPEAPLSMAIAAEGGLLIQTGSRYELYALEGDLEDRVDLARSHATLANELRGELGGRAGATLGGPGVTPDAALEERLRSLGYVE